MSHSGARYCAASNCRNNTADDKCMSFFTFPKDNDRCAEWIENVQSPELKKLYPDGRSLHKRCYLCACHFEEQMFTSTAKNRLKTTAVPTLLSSARHPLIYRAKRKSTSEEDNFPQPLTKQQKLYSSACVSQTSNPLSMCATATVCPATKPVPTDKQQALAAAIRGIQTEISGVTVAKSSQTDASNHETPVPARTSILSTPSSANETPSNATSSMVETEPSTSNTNAWSTDEPMLPPNTHGTPHAKVSCSATSKMVNAGCQTGKLLSTNTPRKNTLRKKKRALARKLRYAEAKSRPPNASGTNPKAEEHNKYAKFLEYCSVFLPKNVADITKEQATLHATKNPKGYRYSMQFKQFALTLFYMSPKAYRYARTIFVLPAPRTLRNITAKWKIQPGFNENVFRVLQAKANSLPANERMCTLCADEMSLKTHLYYNLSDDTIIGVEDLGKEKSFKPATQAMVLMASGINSNWKQPVAYFFSHSTVSGHEVKRILKEYIARLDDVGFDVKMVTSDLGGNFGQAAELLGVTDVDPFFYVGEGEKKKKVFYMFDVPHLIKCTRNNLMNYDFHFNGKVAKWEHIVKYYEDDKKYPLRLTPKLTDKHINPNGFQKMKVRYATQVLSATTAASLNAYTRLKILPEEAKDTAELLALFDKLFDLLNSSSFKARKKWNRPFKGTEEQINFLYYMLKLLQNLKLIDPVTKKDCTNDVYFIKGWKVSIRALLDLWSSCKKEGVDHLFTRRLCQDCLENFFGFLRIQGGNSKNPTPVQFRRAFKKAFCLNYFQKSLGSNCAEDLNAVLASEEALKTKTGKDCTSTDEEIQPSKNDDAQMNVPTATNNASSSEQMNVQTGTKTNSSAEKEVASAAAIIKGRKRSTKEIAISSSDYSSMELPYGNALTYVSGYLVYKCNKVHTCTICEAFAVSNNNTVSPSKVFCQEKAYKSQDNNPFGKLQVPPDDFIKAVEKMEKIFTQNFSSAALTNPHSSILTMIEKIEIQHPCTDFPLEYMRKLFIRLRIYHSLKEANRELIAPCTSRNQKLLILKHL